MATILEQAHAAPAGKYDAMVEEHLRRARWRIRALDLTIGVLALSTGTLAYTLVMLLCDRWIQLSPLCRQASLLVYGAVALFYLLAGLVWPLCRRINPYYAARHLEEVVPGSKNSVVNWLDLRHRPLPSAIRNAVGQRAVHDLTKADLEQAISGRRAAWLGGLTGALALALFTFLVLFGARPFFSLLGRAFSPFGEGIIATQTQLTLLEPVDGDATVPVGKPVRFAVDVGGRVPEVGKLDALRLLFHYQPADPFEERPLEREMDQTWVTTLPAFQVQNGFWYKIVGGDAVTREYRVKVRSTPLVHQFEAIYHYRPYLGWRDDTTHDPNLRALHGTEVALVARTNRTVRIRDSRLELELPKGSKNIEAEAVPDDPQALRFRLVLDADAKYRIWFTSVEGENNTEPKAYGIQVLPDQPPRVVLTKPGREVSLPANGVLPVEGSATDDIGLTRLTLRLQVANGPSLQGRVYRDGKSFRLESGGYSMALEYKDFVDLAKLRGEDGSPFTLQPKTELEYWLEAVDNCDYPEPNVGRSLTYRVKVVEPQADKQKQEKERKQAAEEKSKHDKEQDDQLKKESAAERNGANPEHPPEQPANPEAKQPNEKKGETERHEGKQPDTQPGQKAEPKPGEGQKDKQQQDAEKLASAIQQQQEKKGAAKEQGAKEPKGEAKGEQSSQPKPGEDGQENTGKNQPERSKPNDDQKPGADKSKAKGAGAGPMQEQPGQNKEGGAGQEGQKPDRGEGKPMGQDSSGNSRAPQAETKGTTKPEPAGMSKERRTDGGDVTEQAGMKKDDGHGKGIEAGKKGEEKPAATNQVTGSGVPQGEAKDSDSAGKGTAQDLKPEDVQKLVEKLRSENSGDQGSAEQKLEQARREAKDPAARAAAEKALGEHARERERQSPPGLAKGESPKEGAEPRKDGPPCQCKGGGKGQGERSGQSKDGGAGGGQTQSQSSAKGLGKQTAQSGRPGGDPNGNAKGHGNQQIGGQPGGGNGGGHRLTDSGAVPPPQFPRAEPPDPNQRRHPGDLVLENLRRTLEELRKHPEEYQKVLNRAGLTDRDVRRVESYIDEKLPAPQGGGMLPNLAARKAAAGQSPTPEAKIGTQALPPPGFRTSAREFSRQLADPDKD